MKPQPELQRCARCTSRFLLWLQFGQYIHVLAFVAPAVPLTLLRLKPRAIVLIARSTGHSGALS